MVVTDSGNDIRMVIAIWFAGPAYSLVFLLNGSILLDAGSTRVCVSRLALFYSEY